MKYLKDKKSRRRGIAIELAVMLMLVMVASSTIIITTTMIQVNKQKESFSDLTELVNDIEKIEYDQIGKAFEEEISQLKLSKEDLSNQYDYNEIVLNIENNLNDKFSSYLDNKGLLFEIGLNKVETEKDPIHSTSEGNQEKVEKVTDTVDDGGIATRIIESTEMVDGKIKKVTTTKRRQSDETIENVEDIKETININEEVVGKQTTRVNTQIWSVTIETYTEYDTVTTIPYDVTYTFTLKLYKKVGNDVNGNALKGDLLLEVVFEKTGTYSITTASKIKETKIETQEEKEITTNITKNYFDENREDKTEPEIKEFQLTELVLDNERSSSDTVVKTTYSYLIEIGNDQKISWIYK